MITAAPAKFYAYAVVNVETEPKQLVAIGLTRQLARQELQKELNQAPLRVRRCKLTLFET